MKVKIKIKNKLKRIKKNKLDGQVEKKTLIKGKKNQKTKLKKIKQHKLLLDDEIEN